MFCGKCGSPIKDGNSFCSICGAPIDSPVAPTNDSAPQYSSQPIDHPAQTVPVYMMTQSAPPTKSNGFAIVGLVLGIFAICLCWIPYVGLVLGFAGLVFSIIGISKVSSCRSGRGQAITGLILSIFGLFFGAVLTLGISTYLNKARQEAYESSVHASKVAEVDAEIEAQLG